MTSHAVTASWHVSFEGSGHVHIRGDKCGPTSPELTPPPYTLNTHSLSRLTCETLRETVSDVSPLVHVSHCWSHSCRGVLFRTAPVTFSGRAKKVSLDFRVCPGVLTNTVNFLIKHLQSWCLMCNVVSEVQSRQWASQQSSAPRRRRWPTAPQTPCEPRAHEAVPPADRGVYIWQRLFSIENTNHSSPWPCYSSDRL